MPLSLDDIRRYFLSHNVRSIHDPALKQSAVLLPLVRVGGELHIIFNLRSNDVEHHKGQVSFPGGMCEPHDGSFAATALREAEEEIGLDPASVTILGTLHDLATPSGFIITPIVGLIDSMPQFAPNPSEVERIFDVPLRFFLDPAHKRTEVRQRLGVSIEVPVYQFGEFEIWGATAMILTSFLEDVLAAKKAL